MLGKEVSMVGGDPGGRPPHGVRGGLHVSEYRRESGHVNRIFFTLGFQ